MLFMKFLSVYQLTGRHANNLKIARRLNRKLLARQQLGECTVLEWERVEIIEGPFLACVALGLRVERVRFGCLPDSWQVYLPAEFELPPAPCPRTSR